MQTKEPVNVYISLLLSLVCGTRISRGLFNLSHNTRIFFCIEARNKTVPHRLVVLRMHKHIYIDRNFGCVVNCERADIYKHVRILTFREPSKRQFLSS